MTARLREAVKRYNESGDPSIPYYDGILSFDEMREKCHLEPEEIEVGLVGGERALRKLSLVQAEKRRWKWRDSKIKGRDRTNWLIGERWLEIVESKHGFGGGGDAG
ncbi:MAG: hypothetical protein ACLQU1_18785 [Bryobacteraceae bacterium]